MAKISSFDDIRKNHKRIKRMWTSVWIAATIILAFFVYSEKDAIKSMGVSGWIEELFLQGSSENFPINLPTGADRQISAVNGQLAISQKGEISYYSLIGQSLDTKRITYQNPLAISNDKRLVVMDLGAYGLRIEDKGSVVMDTTLSTPILGGSLSPSGMFAITTANDRYTSRVEVYDKQLNKFFTYNSSEHIVINTAVSDKRLAISGVTTQNGQLSCRVVMSPLNGKDSEVITELGNEMVFFMEFTSDGHLLTVSDKGVKLISITGGILEAYNYSDTVSAFALDDSDGVWLVEGDYTRTHQNDIVHIGKDLKVKSKIEADYYINKIIPYKGNILVVSPDGVRKYNNKLELSDTIVLRNVIDGTMVDKYLYLITGDSLHRYVIAH